MDRSQVGVKCPLTRGECEEILSKAVSVTAQLKDYVLVPAEAALGFLGEYYHLTLNYLEMKIPSSAQQQSVKLFAKLLPVQNTEKFKAYIFKKEAHLYATLLPELRKYSSECLFAVAYHVRDDLLVLQDLHEMGYKVCQPHRANLDDWEVKCILRSFAALHAASIAYEEHSGNNILDQYSQQLLEITVAPHVAWWTVGLRALLAVAQQHGKLQSEEMQNFISNELSKRLDVVYELVNPSDRYRNVFCQRDPWCSNVFLPTDNNNNSNNNDDDEKAAVLVDFQTCRYSPACIDLLLIFYMNLEESVRARDEKGHLKYYYAHFRKYLQQQNIESEHHMTEDDLLKSYEEFRIFGLVYNALAMTVIKVPKELVTNQYRDTERAAPLLAYMETNPKFREEMENCVEQIIECLL